MRIANAFKTLIGKASLSLPSRVSSERGETQKAGIHQAILLDKNLSSFQAEERDRIKRALLAKEAGLDVEGFALPFPGNTITNNKSNGLGGPLLGAALLGTGLAAAPFISSLLNPKPVTTPAVIPPAITQSAVQPIVPPVTTPGRSQRADIRVEVVPPPDEQDVPPAPAVP